MKNFKILTVAFFILFMGGLFWGGCSKQEEKAVTTMSVHTPLIKQLSKEQSVFQNAIDELYTYEAKVTKDFDDREQYEIPIIFANESIKNYWKRLVRIHARHVDKNWDPVANSATVQWDLQAKVDEFIVLPVYIDYKPMTLIEVNGQYEPTQEFTIYAEDVDEKMYFTTRIDADGNYLIVNVNPEQIQESDIKEFSWEYTEKHWNELLEKIRQKIEDDPNVKWSEDYIDGIITPDQMHYHLQDEREKAQQDFSSNDIQNRATYNRIAAANYAYMYASGSNPAYRVFSNDCSNFVSQCLKNGGFSNDNTPNNTTSCNCWWYNTNGTSATNNDTNSQTWSTANGLRNYMQSCQSYASTISGVNGYYSVGVEKGDVMFMDFGSLGDGIYDHALIVYRIAQYIPPGGNVCYYIPNICAHTNPQQDRPLWQSPFGYNIVVTSNVTKFGHILNTN